MSTVTFVDESLPGTRTEIATVEFPTSVVSVREIIVRRVAQDVVEYNADRRRMAAHGLVVPTAVEAELNEGAAGGRGRRREVSGLLDEEAMRRAALAAFEADGFFLFVGDRQVTSLEERVEIGLETEVVFIKLVPLVGG